MWILLILSAILLIGGVVSYFVTFVPILMAAARTAPSSSSLQAFPLASFAVTFVCILAGNVIELVARIGALIKQAKQQQWAWFVCTLLFGWICTLIYLIVWPMPPQPVAPARKYASQHRPTDAQRRKQASKKY